MFLLFVAAGAGLLALSHIAPFPFLLDALTPVPSRWSMPAVDGVPTIYLTYDDGPNPTATPDLLDVLAREGAVATFFVLDRISRRRPRPSSSGCSGRGTRWPCTPIRGG